MKNSLMAELGAWNQLENTFKQIFNAEALEDRDFQKMKLKEYERISFLYGERPLSRDEKAMQVMLKFQKAKLERKLYPGLTRRLLRRIAEFFNTPIDIKRELAMVKQAGYNNYQDLQLPVKTPDADQVALRKQQSVEQKPHHKHAPGRNRPHVQKHKHRKGHSF